MRKPPGVILYDGPSILDGQPIIVIATFESKNAKTGNMIQVWVMRKDIHPLDAIRNGSDFSVCGNCPHRGVIIDGQLQQRSCYVAVEKAPSNIWKSYHRGNYVDYDVHVLKYFQNRKIRWGAYGDPCLIPEQVVSFLSHMCDGHTGYTHLWRDPRFSWARKFFQASCDTWKDYLDASSAGWGTFRVVPKGETPSTGVHCPADVNKSVHCEACRMCKGGYNLEPKHIFIPAHGRGAKYVA